MSNKCQLCSMQAAYIGISLQQGVKMPSPSHPPPHLLAAGAVANAPHPHLQPPTTRPQSNQPRYITLLLIRLKASGHGLTHLPTIKSDSLFYREMKFSVH
eukprot:scaffold81088_cov60-Cyclotella_meneghiniana.AAC.4